MKTQFSILLSFKTPAGYKTYGQYFFGNDKDAAYELFDQLQGSPDIDRAPLHIDLMEIVNELPVRIKTICCTLTELSDNCQLIAKTLFRLKTLKELEV
jgi:hypothetical protein